jgi:hypothetical protein
MLQAIVVYIHERRQEPAEPEQRNNIVSSFYCIVSSPNAEYKRYVIRQEDTPSYFFVLSVLLSIEKTLCFRGILGGELQRDNMS